MLGSEIQSAEASAEYVKTAAHLKKKKPLLNLCILFYLVHTNVYKQLANVFIFQIYKRNNSYFNAMQLFVDFYISKSNYRNQLTE